MGAVPFGENNANRTRLKHSFSFIFATNFKPRGPIHGCSLSTSAFQNASSGGCCATVCTDERLCHDETDGQTDREQCQSATDLRENSRPPPDDLTAVQYYPKSKTLASVYDFCSRRDVIVLLILLRRRRKLSFQVIAISLSFCFTLIRPVFDHPRSGVVCNFGRVCLSDDNFRKPWRRKFIFAHPVYLQENGSCSYMKVRVKVKVTRAIKVENLYSRNVKLRSAITPVLEHIRPWRLRSFPLRWIVWCNRHLCHVTGSIHGWSALD